MAPHSAPVESPGSPEGSSPSSDDESESSSTISADENPLNGVEFELEFNPITGEYVCVVDVSGLGIDNMDLMLDIPEDLFTMDNDPEVLLETFLDWEIPLILEALQEEN